MNILTRIKRLLLPFEFEDHPLYAPNSHAEFAHQYDNEMLKRSLTGTTGSDLTTSAKRSTSPPTRSGATSTTGNPNDQPELRDQL